MDTLQGSNLGYYSFIRVVFVDGLSPNNRSCELLNGLLQAPGMPANFGVEASQPDGTTVWLGDFMREELELVEHPGEAVEQ